MRPARDVGRIAAIEHRESRIEPEVAGKLKFQDFVDGMTEALIARLSRIPDLKVVSRTSAMQLKNSDMSIPDIARTLGVDGVIEVEKQYLDGAIT